jgi:hypothetical protein
MPPPRRKVARRSGRLTESERAILGLLAAGPPTMSAGQLCLEFEARSGRAISGTTAASYLRGRPPASAYHLTGPQRAMLADLCWAASPDYPRGEIARDFAILTGRQISIARVSQFLTRSLGLPRIIGRPLARGTDRRDAYLTRAVAVARIDSEAEKRAEIPERRYSRRARVSPAR